MEAKQAEEEEAMNWVKLLGGADVFIDGKKGICKSCSSDFEWGTTKNNKWIPVVKDEEGNYMSHFANCAGASSHRKNNGRSADATPRAGKRTPDII